MRYVKLARSVLRQRVTEDGRVENLAATDIVAFLSAESSPLSVGSTNGRVAELQALLKFLYVAGLAPQPLVTLVPPVAGWHDTGVPKANPAAAATGELRPDQPDRCQRPTAWASVPQPDRLHPRHRSLLQHELADQDLPGGDIGLAPRQVAPGDVIPAEQFGRANRHRASPPVGGTMSTCLTRIR